MNSKEKKWINVFALWVIVITTIPYLIGYSRQGTDWVYTGFLFGVEDGHSYIGKMQRGTAGDWTFRSPYTAYSQNGFVGFLPYIILGKLASPPGTHEQLAALFHLFRIASIYFLVIVLYRFTSLFIQHQTLKKYCLVVCVFGGGLGWLYLIGGSSLWSGVMPLEFYSPETFGFLSVLGLPHLAAARGFLLLSLCLLFSGESSNWVPQGIWVGLAWIGVGIMQPLTVLIGWFVFINTLVFVYIFSILYPSKWKFPGFPNLLQKGLTGILVSSPLVVYTAVSFQTDSYLQEWAKQNLIYSPPPGDYFLAFGIMLGVIFATLRRVIANSSEKIWIILGWVFILPLLAYFPYPLQRRLPEASWVALSLLAFAGLEKIPFKNFLLAKSITAFSLLTSIIFYSGTILSVWNPGIPLFRPRQEIKAYSFLTELKSQNQVILASYDISNVLPAWAPNFVLIGHGPESIHLKEVQPRVECFYQSTCPQEDRKNLISQFNVRYVFKGPDENILGDYALDLFDWVQKIYEKDGYSIYEVDIKQ